MRLLAALYPQLAVRTVGDEYTDETLPGDWTCDETATHRRRLREIYLTALVDDDGRVRRAAVKASKELAVTADRIGATDELQTMRTDVETVANECDDELFRRISIRP